MRGSSQIFCHVCLRHARAQQAGFLGISRGLRRLHDSPPSNSQQQGASSATQQNGETKSPESEQQGAMSRRLSEMSDSMLESSGRGAQKAVEEAGFSEELKLQLQERIAKASFASANAQAISIANLAPSAGAGTKDIAGARPWSGNETLEDATLRMLDDTHKRIRAPPRQPGVRMPKKVDTGRQSAKLKVGSAQGTRLANARDQTSRYAYLKDASTSEKERDAMRKELKERFTAGARDVPATLTGLASLANERIEDAIARGQFKNLPRGKAIERDYNASSPFLDTTEYFMNKIIQKQEIVPPWIEKQQELVSESTKFRSRLRSDWKRHVARLISSRGGSVQQQVALAEEYARAEAIDNPPKKKVESVSTVHEGGHLSQITLSGELKTSGVGASEIVETVTVSHSDSLTDSSAEGTSSTIGAVVAPDASAMATAPQSIGETGPPPMPMLAPFRDPAWLKIEAAYHNLAISNLNSTARSYNLMAPDLAKKPYFSLERELRSCYADMAPLIGAEILERSRIPVRKVRADREKDGLGPGNVLERLSGGPSKVYDEIRPKYGFREFWRDLFAKNVDKKW